MQKATCLQTQGRQNTVFCELQEQNGCDLGSEGELAGDKTRQVSKVWIMRMFSIPSTRIVVPGTVPASGRFSGYVCGLWPLCMSFSLRAFIVKETQFGYPS